MVELDDVMLIDVGVGVGVGEGPVLPPPPPQDANRTNADTTHTTPPGR